jgi:broad specificity phosphatase PhoE
MPCLQAAEAASKLIGYTVDYVITSPFKRCLQTSAGAVRRLPDLPAGHWLVDWQLAEVCYMTNVICM